MLTRFQGWAQARMPTREGMAGNRFLAPVAHRVLSPELWRFTRRSVPRGVMLGMLTGFMVPVGQTVAAAFLALPMRANVPVAVLVTFITNPFTYPFWVVIANRLGALALRVDALTHGQPLTTKIQSGWGQWLSWFMREAAVTAFGFVLIGVVLAAAGYFLSKWGWAWWIGEKRARHRRARLAREQDGAAR